MINRTFEIFIENPTIENRNRFIQESLPMIKALAYKYRRVNFLLDQEDLVNAGVIGICESLDRNARTGMTFPDGRRAVWYGVRSGILDELRRWRKLHSHELQKLKEGTAGEKLLALFDRMTMSLSIDFPVTMTNKRTTRDTVGDFIEGCPDTAETFDRNAPVRALLESFDELYKQDERHRAMVLYRMGEVSIHTACQMLGTSRQYAYMFFETKTVPALLASLKAKAGGGSDCRDFYFN